MYDPPDRLEYPMKRTATRWDRIERLSGMAHLTEIDVEIRPAAGPLDPTLWSGMPERSTRTAPDNPGLPR
jgi:hypothetical protein